MAWEGKRRGGGRAQPGTGVCGERSLHLGQTARAAPTSHLAQRACFARPLHHVGGSPSHVGQRWRKRKGDDELRDHRIHI